MSSASPDPPAADPAPPALVSDSGEPLPETSRHEPSVRPWELELLISAAVVFSLLQLPGMVDSAFDRVMPHLGGRGALGGFLLYTYVKMALYALIGGFVLHLAARAYWVGLIGLEAVFPAGIKWENTSYGHVMGDVFRERMGRLQGRIDAADRFCSILFPMAFTLVMLSAYSTVLLSVVAAFAFAVSRIPGGPGFNAVFLATAALLVSFPMLAWAADRLFGAGARRGTRRYRALERLSLAAYYVNAMPAYGTVFLTLYSNARKGKRNAVYVGVLGLLLSAVLVNDVFVRQGLLRASGTIDIPDVAGPYGVDPDYYEDQRRRGEPYDRVPSIQSDVVRGPYVRLFIPYRPTRHGEAFRDACPDLRPLSPAGVRLEADAVPAEADVRAVLDCWRSLQPVTLNGAPLDADFHFFTHPRTGVRGIVAYLPTAELPRGANLITVAPAPRSADDRRRRGEDRDPPPPDYIRFWR